MFEQKLLTNLTEEQKNFFVWTYKLKVETGAISVYCIYLLMCAITRWPKNTYFATKFYSHSFPHPFTSLEGTKYKIGVSRSPSKFQNSSEPLKFSMT